MKKIIFILFSLLLPFSVFASNGVISPQDWTQFSEGHSEVCFGAFYTGGGAGFFNPANSRYSVFYGGISGSWVPVASSTVTGGGWPQGPNPSPTGPTSHTWCLTTSQVQSYGTVTSMVDNANGDCTAHGNGWTIIDCANAGGITFESFTIPNTSWTATILNSVSGNSTIQANNIQGEVRTQNSNNDMAASGVGPGNIASFMVGQITLIIGSGLGILISNLPYILALIFIFLVICFLYYCFKVWINKIKS